LLAGAFVIGSVVLRLTVDTQWFIFTSFVGVMLTIFALTGFYPMSIILHALGARERCGC
jgi:hypothetical protein